MTLLTFGVFSQNETANWYFGNGAGISFNNGVRTILNDGAMVAPAGCSSISDKNGNLMFYTNGQTIWNRNHQIMDNGDGMSGQIDMTQNSIIVPNPDDENIYYLFTLRQEIGNTFHRGVYYSTIEFSAAYPLGHVTDEKNIQLVNASSERITAIYMPEVNAYKVITFSKQPYTLIFGVPVPQNQEIDTFCYFDVTGSGVSFSTLQTAQYPTVSSAGAMKISPNGQYLAIADNEQSRIFIYTVDLASETISYLKFINTGLFGAPTLFPYGVEFSPDSNVIYFSNNYTSIYQFHHTSTADVVDKLYLGNPSPFKYGSLQLAMDGKIYIAVFADDGSSPPYLSVINYPDKTTPEECGFEKLTISLGSNGSFRGLPNFVQSYFENRILTENRCVSDMFDFDLNAYGPIQSATWEFGDGNTSNSLTPTHQFQNPGEYVVKSTIEVYGKSIDLYKLVEVFPLPNADPGVIMTQCDTDNDGISFFNLYEFHDYIDDGDTVEFELSFFHTYQQAVDDISPIENPEAYENTVNNQEIFVRMISPEGCMSISNFFLESQYALLDGISDMYVCEGSDSVFGNSTGRFNLRTKTNEVRTQFSIPDASTVTFYATLQDAQTMANPLPDDYSATSSTIWVRVDGADGDCGGVGPIQLHVSSNLVINLEDEYVICDPSLQPPIILDGSPSNDQWEWRDGSGNIISTQRFFHATQPGSYSLTVYKTENGLECSRTKNFTVINSGVPIFDELHAEDYQIFVEIDGDSSYEYSLNGVNFYGDGTSHTFSGVEAGIHTVYVRDKENCEPPIQQNVSFIGFPKYFTPNGDGYNDTWQIEGISKEFYNTVDIWIYDRYGKNLDVMDINSNVYGWDGRFNGNILIAADYWYKAILVDKEMNTYTVTGHFSLVH